MSTRTRGLLLFLGNGAVAFALYRFVFPIFSGPVRHHVAAYGLAMPFVGAAIGLLEWTSGLPMSRLDEGWQRLPGYVRVPVALIGSLLFLWGLIKFLGF